MIKVKVPKKIPIGGHTFTIKFTKNLIRDEGNRAQLRWHSENIEIDPDMPYANVVSGLLHELTHAIDRGYCGDTLSEVQIMGIAEGFLQVMNALGIKFDWSDISK